MSPKSQNPEKNIPRKYTGKKDWHEINEERQRGRQQQRNKRVAVKGRKGEAARESDGQMVTEGMDYFLVLAQSFFCVGSFSQHCTLGADNRWSYHYCKTHNPHSNSLCPCRM